MESSLGPYPDPVRGLELDRWRCRIKTHLTGDLLCLRGWLQLACVLMRARVPCQLPYQGLGGEARRKRRRIRLQGDLDGLEKDWRATQCRCPGQMGWPAHGFPRPVGLTQNHGALHVQLRS